jgi:hypothetical protein
MFFSHIKKTQSHSGNPVLVCFYHSCLALWLKSISNFFYKNHPSSNHSLILGADLDALTQPIYFIPLDTTIILEICEEAHDS